MYFEQKPVSINTLYFSTSFPQSTFWFFQPLPLSVLFYMVQIVFPGATNPTTLPRGRHRVPTLMVAYGGDGERSVKKPTQGWK